MGKANIGGTSLDGWPTEDIALATFLRDRQKAVPFAAINDPVWWEAVGESVNGIDMQWLEREFGRMRAWLIENKTRTPSKPAGWKRFVRHWLEGAYERERRKGIT